MNFYEQLKAKAIGSSGGGDTPSPSGDPHFSQILVSTPGAIGCCFIYSDDGTYTIPTKSAINGILYITLCTPVKSITGITNLEDDQTIAFTPADDFSADFEIHGDITNGDGKSYDLYAGGEENTYAVENTGEDFVFIIE